MKIIILERGSSHKTPNISLAPDSALSKDSRPVFLPDEGAPWRGDMVAAYRVCRLGKNIPERFANRYYDAVTVAVVARPAPDSLPMALALTADGAVSIGSWMELSPEDREYGTKEHVISTSGKTYRFNDANTGITEAIHHLSRFMTLKMGDIIIPAAPTCTIDLPIDTRIEADLDDLPTLAYSIK